MVASKEELIRHAISPYRDEEFSDTVKYNRAMSVRYDVNDNPASTKATLTLDHTNVLLTRAYGDLFSPLYIGEYFFRQQHPAAGGEGDDDDDGVFHPPQHAAAVGNPPQVAGLPPNAIRFPFLAYPVPHGFREPKCFFSMNLAAPPVVDPALPARVRLRNERVAARDCDVDEKPDLLLKGAGEIIKGRMASMVDVQTKTEFRQSIEVRRLLQFVHHNDRLNPGGDSCHFWRREHIKANPNWSQFTQDALLVDSSLSAFGNKITKDLYELEVKCGVAVLHSEILYIQLASLLSFDVKDGKFRLHTLFHGPPATGKSFILDMHDMLSPQGMVHWIAVQTKRANTTEECFNGMQMVMDELGEMFTSKGDGTGMQEIKTLLTKGELETEMAWVEDGKRITIMTKSQRKCQWITCSNERPSVLPAPVRDRFYMHFIPAMYRPKYDPVLEMERIRADPSRMLLIEELGERWKSIYDLSNQYWVANRISDELMPSIDTSFASQILAIMFEHVKLTFGIEIPLRARSSILDFARAICLYDAITEVFFSGRVIPPGTLFSENHIFHLIPYLFVKREHVYFAFSKLHQLIVDPALPSVIVAIRHLIENEPLVNNRYAASSDGGGDINYDYYLVPVSGMASNDNIADSVATKLAGVVKQTCDQTISVEIIRDLIEWLVSQQKRCRRFSGSDGALLDGPPVNMPVANIRRAGTSKYGLEISRAFVDEFLADHRDVILSAINCSIDEFCPQSRFVTGITFKGGCDLPDPTIHSPKGHIYPFIYKVLDVNPNNHRRITLEKKGHQRFLERFFAGENTLQTELKFEVCQTDKETACRQEWLNKHGGVLPNRDVAYAYAADLCPVLNQAGEWEASKYPEYVIKGVISEYVSLDALPEDMLDEQAAANQAALHHAAALPPQNAFFNLPGPIPPQQNVHFNLNE